MLSRSAVRIVAKLEEQFLHSSNTLQQLLMILLQLCKFVAQFTKETAGDRGGGVSHGDGGLLGAGGNLI